jgi:hypothetical protein
MMVEMRQLLVGVLSLLMVSMAMAEESVPAVSSEVRGLGEQVETLKKEILDLNRDLFMLEEELLFPATTQTTIFLAMNTGVFFALDAVELKIDGKVVSNYLYTEREVAALARGGVQKLHIENLRSGKHELVAVFVGKGPNGRDYRRAASYEFEKGLDPKFIELKISDSSAKEQPEFAIDAWE